MCSWGGCVRATTKVRANVCSGGRCWRPLLRGALIQSGLATTRAKETALQARYLRIKRRRGHKKAVVAVGHQILEIAYYIMRDGTTYQELGPNYFARRDRERTVRRSLRQLEALGYRVTIEEAA